MNKTLGALVVLATCTLGAGTPVLAGDIVGTVVNASGDPVDGARILTSTGASAVTDQAGRYAIRDLPSSQYNITLDPAGSGLKGQSVVSYVGNKGLTVDWATATNREPIATAQPGTNFVATGSSSKTFASTAQLATAPTAPTNPPPGCKGMDGPPCGPKTPKK
jgi:hypothetical protein